MEKHYIELGGIKYRVEFNWNTTASFLAATGRDDMASLVTFSFAPTDMTALVRCAIKEGERLEGREFNLTAEEIGEYLTATKVMEVLRIFKIHNGADDNENEDVEAKESKKKGLFRHSKRPKA